MWYNGGRGIVLSPLTAGSVIYAADCGASTGKRKMHAQQPPRSYPRMPPTRAQDETPVGEEGWLREAVIRLERSISDATSLIEDNSHRVDEFQNLSSVAESVTSVQTTPDYDMYDAIIEAVVVTGPTTGNVPFTLQLGKRIWSLQLPATGILVLSPLKMSLGRDDQRLLTSATAGPWALELMGYADIRYRYK